MRHLAIIFCGHLRTFAKTRDNWTKTIAALEAEYQVDTFLHTWSNVGNRLDLTEGEIVPRKGAFALATFSQDPIPPLENIVDFGFKATSVEHYKETETKEAWKINVLPLKKRLEKAGHTDVRNMTYWAQAYKKRQGFKMAQQYAADNGFQYDLVAFTRPDFIPTEPIGKLNHTNTNVFVYDPLVPLFHDFFVCGPTKEMEMYAGLYNRMDETFEWIEKTHGIDQCMCGHKLMSSHFHLSGVKSFNEIEMFGSILRGEQYAQVEEKFIGRRDALEARRRLTKIIPSATPDDPSNLVTIFKPPRVRIR